MGPEFWAQQAGLLLQVMLPLVERGANEGALGGIDMLKTSVTVQWELVNEAARTWAKGYTFELVKGITASTMAAFQEEFEAWVRSGEPLDALMDALATEMSRTRAEAIAITETTRCFAEGNLLAWRESGVVEGVVWMTAEDEDVCEICEPLDGVLADLQAPVFEAGDLGMAPPPAHVRCRCWMYPKEKGIELNLAELLWNRALKSTYTVSVN